VNECHDDSCHRSGNYSLFQINLISLQLSKCNVSSSLNQLCWNLISTWRSTPFQLPINIELSGLTTRHGGTWGERTHKSYYFLTSAPEGGEWSAPCLAVLYPRGKNHWYPLYRRLAGHLSWSWTKKLTGKISASQ
jgi:hypothetical protein